MEDLANYRTPSKEKIRGPITTTAISAQKYQLIKNTLNHAEPFEAFKIQEQTLNLQRNSAELYNNRGRIQVHYSLFIPRNSMLAVKKLEDVHIKTLHGGVNLTMTEVRRKYWIPHLQSLTKRIIKVCYSCKRFQETAFNTPCNNSNRNNRSRLRWTKYYRINTSKKSKAYLLLLSSSLTRAGHIQTVQCETTNEFV